MDDPVIEFVRILDDEKVQRVIEVLTRLRNHMSPDFADKALAVLHALHTRKIAEASVIRIVWASKKDRKNSLYEWTAQCKSMRLRVTKIKNKTTNYVGYIDDEEVCKSESRNNTKAEVERLAKNRI